MRITHLLVLSLFGVGCYGPDTLPDLGPDQSVYFIPDMAVGDLAPEADMFRIVPHPPSTCTKTGEVQVTNDTVYGFDWYWDSDHYELVYNTSLATNGGTLRSVQLNAAGGQLNSPIDIDVMTGASTNPQLAHTSNGYVVVWESGTAGAKAVWAQTLNANGTVATTPTFPFAPAMVAEARPTVAYSRGKITVAWMDMAMSGYGATMLATIDPSTLLLPAMTAPIVVGDPANENKFPNLVGDASSLAMTYTARPNVAGASANSWIAVFNADLSVASSAQLRANQPNDAALPRVIKTTTGYYSAWEDGRVDPLDYLQVYAVTTNAAGAKQLETLVPDPNTGDANWPNMVTRGTNIAAVYYQYRSGSDPNIYMSYLDANGHHVLNGANGGDILVSSTPAGKQARFPDIQLAGSDFGIAWIDTRGGNPQVYFAKVTCPQ